MAFRAIAEAVISVTTSSAKVPIPYLRVQDAGGHGNVAIVGNAVRLQADGADLRFKIGGSTVVATTSDTLLQDNAIETFSVNAAKDTHIAAIVASSTSSLKITLGVEE